MRIDQVKDEDCLGKSLGMSEYDKRIEDEIDQSVLCGRALQKIQEHHWQETFGQLR